MAGRREIRAHESQADAILEALSKVQPTGKAQGDVSVLDVVHFAQAAEARLDKLGIPVGKRPGALFEKSRIAGAEAKSYRHARKGTVIYLRRGAKAWFLAGVERASFWPKQPRVSRLYLTKEQDQAAIEATRACYRSAEERLEELARKAQRWEAIGGMVTTHVRKEAEGVRDANSGAPFDRGNGVAGKIAEAKAEAEAADVSPHTH